MGFDDGFHVGLVGLPSSWSVRATVAASLGARGRPMPRATCNSSGLCCGCQEETQLFMLDNVAIHVAHSTKSFLLSAGVQLLVWPARLKPH